jgi:RNA polymerase sigma factor (sigma-70 family)
LGTNPNVQIMELLNVHLDSAYNLARWLTGNNEDAQDVVQEACMRALKFASGYRGENGRAWFLTIVRNTCYTWLKQNRNLTLSPDVGNLIEQNEDGQSNTETIVIRRFEMETLSKAIAALPTEFREVIVLREIEELSYKEISHILQVPMGTIMSRLARARERLLEIGKVMK